MQKPFKKTGLKLGESNERDLKLFDDSLGLSLIISSEFFEAGQNKPEYVEKMLKQLCDFYKRHFELRVERAKNDFMDLYNTQTPENILFCKNHRDCLLEIKNITDKTNPRQIEKLHRWETDLYFFNRDKNAGNTKRV